MHYWQDVGDGKHIICHYTLGRIKYKFFGITILARESYAAGILPLWPEKVMVNKESHFENN